MPNIYNPIDLNTINTRIDEIRAVLPNFDGELIRTEENAMDVVGNALKNGTSSNNGIEILYESAQDTVDEISVRLKSTPNTIFYANEDGLLMPLQIGNDFTISNGVLSAVKSSRSIAKNKLIYTASSSNTNWYGDRTPTKLYDGEGGSGTDTGADGMIAAEVKAIDITVSFATPKWINAFKIYPGQFTGAVHHAPEFVEVFVGNTTDTPISMHCLVAGVTQTIDTTFLDAYTNVGKHSQYTFRFKNALNYLSIMELVLWGDD